MFFNKQSLQASGIISQFTDIHSHILYAVDDGVRTQQEALTLLAWLEKQQVRKIWLTPHIMEDMPNSSEKLKKRFRELQAVYQGPIELRLSAEYMLDTVFLQRWQTGDLLPLGENHLLVETSCLVPMLGVENTLYKLQTKNFRPILAHPERYMYMEKEEYDTYKRQGILFQLNLMSLTGAYGPNVRQKARDLLHKGMYDFAGSDIHSLTIWQKAAEKKCLTPAEIRSIRQLNENNKLL